MTSVHRTTTSARRAHRATGRPAPAHRGAALDLTAALVLTIATTLLARSASAHGGPPFPQTQLLLGLGAAGAGAAAAGLAALTPRLAASPRGPHPYVAAALLLHSLLLMPASVVDTAAGPGLHWLAVTRLTAAVCFVLLLAAGLLPRPPRWSQGRRGVLTAAGAAAAAGALGATVPALAPLTASPVPTVAVGFAWLGISAGYLSTGLRGRDRLRLRLGLGLAMASAGQFGGIPGHAGWLPGLTAAALRLLGLLIVLATLGADFLREAEQVEDRLQDSDRLARQVAERDHEMRNVLTGLSGAAYLLRAAGSRLGPAEQAELGAAVQAELERLRELLARDDGRPAGAAEGHEVEPVLRRLVVLRRTVGADVELTADPGLRTTVPASVLAQVVTNLLVNCERHAPGARVRVTAACHDRLLRIEVADDGPGLPPGAETEVLQRGVRDTGAGGSGLGLYVSARMLGEHGGTVRLLPHDPLRPGCTAVLELPAAGSHPRASAA